MAVSVVMPALEMAQETGKLVRWIKQEGDEVTKGEMLLEVETDKAVVEIEAQSDGILAGIIAKVDDVIPVGQTIAWLVKPGEAPPTSAGPTPTGRKMDAPAPGTAGAGVATAAAPAGGARISPRARGLARDHGVDLSTINGSGPGGEILADDVLKAAATVANSAALTSIGRIMAERTTQSWTTVPHFFLTREVDATVLSAARERLLPQIQQSHGVKLTHTDLIVSAVGRALRQHPRMNASWNNGSITINHDVNIALAIAVENAVVTAVIGNADRASLGDLARQRTGLANRARANRLQPADIAGATFTISNLGMFEVDAFTAIIVPPQAGILAVGTIKDRVVAVNATTAIRPMTTLTLSSDHRVVDGTRAAAFLADVVRNMSAF
jgi:pyruvate dehydrogenase E2 component (dihydrolipoamide acetyltransferase)